MPNHTDYKMKEGAQQTAALKAQAKAQMLNRAVKMYQDGVPVVQISRVTHISSETLYARLTELNIPKRTRYSKPLPP